MALDTHNVCWTNWLDNPYQAGGVSKVIREFIGNQYQDANLMVSNVAYDFAVARIKCWRDRGPLPAWNNAAGMSAFHKRGYNTAGGISANVAHFKAAIAA